MTTGTAVKPRVGYVAAAAALVAVGVVAGQLLVRADVSFTPAEGVSVFAVLYVLAQGVERVVEFVISSVTLVDGNFAENRKRRAVSLINSTTNGNPQGLDASPAKVAEAQEEAKEARLDLGVFSQGLAFALAYALVSYFEFGIFDAVGVTGIAPGADRALTAVAVMGGAKGLHDLLGKIQKSKEASETPGSAPAAG